MKEESSRGAFQQLSSVQRAHLPKLTSVELGPVSLLPQQPVGDSLATVAVVHTCQWQRSLLCHVNPKRSHLQDGSRPEVPMDRCQDNMKQS